MKKLIAVLMGLMLLGGCSSSHAFNLNKESRAEVAKEERIHFKIGVAMDAEGGLEDRTFTEKAWTGFTQYATRYPSTKIQMVKAREAGEVEKKRVIEELAQIKADIIFGMGPSFKDIFQEVHENYPDIKFVLLGGNLENVGENVASIDFESQQSAFLAGVAAAGQTVTGKIGFLGGKKQEDIYRQELGFAAGIVYANERFGTRAQLERVEYAGCFDDIRTGRQLAKNIFADGVDVLYVCAGITGNGAMEETKVLVEHGADVWYIGCDKDQYDDGALFDGRSVTLTSTVKKLDVSIYEMLDLFVRGHFPSGAYWQKSMEGDRVGLPVRNNNFTGRTATFVSDAEKSLKERKVTLPFNVSELEKQLAMSKNRKNQHLSKKAVSPVFISYFLP